MPWKLGKMLNLIKPCSLILKSWKLWNLSKVAAVPAPANTGLLRPPNTIVYFIPKYLYKLFCVVGAPDLFYRSYQCSAHLGSIQAGQVNVFTYLIIWVPVVVGTFNCSPQRSWIWIRHFSLCACSRIADPAAVVSDGFIEIVKNSRIQSQNLASSFGEFKLIRREQKVI